jgi:tetratricopeptide (TPR) repeat protein
MDQLRKRLNHPIEERLAFLEGYLKQVNDRDDLYIEYITLLNLSGEYDRALKLLRARNFHPWEGGEGKVSGQYVLTHIELAKQALDKKDLETALDLLKAAQIYPLNLGEGKLFGNFENDIHYWQGCTYEALDDRKRAKEHWEKAASGSAEAAAAVFYNDQQPDKIFYQGLALLKLGRNEEAFLRFNNLVQYGEQHYNDDVKIDYFAVSLPDLMIFDDDLNTRNKIHCHYLIALGKLGLAQFEEAEHEFIKVLEMERSHQGAAVHLKMAQQVQHIN